MRKKNFRKGVSLVLVASMSAAMLAGCGGQEEEGKKEAQGGKNDVPTYTIATVRWTDAWPTDFLESGVMKELEEKHGINIEWQIYYNSDWSEQKSLLLASGDLPDAFLGSISLNATDVAQNKSSFLELTDYINEETMPNLVSVFEKDPEMKAIATDRDGKIYSLPKKLPLRPEVCGNPLYINKEWLDNLGLDVPKTYKELETVLEKFITEDADKDGDPNNEIGFSNSASTALLSGDLRTILAPFGTMVSRDNNYIHEKGTPVMRPYFYDYPEDKKAWEVEDSYLFGTDFLVAPVLEAGAREREVYLPKGEVWIDVWTGEERNGGETITVSAPLEKIPVFAKKESEYLEIFDNFS